MNMQPTIELLAEKKLVGVHMNMTLADDKTRELWQRLMPRRKEISNNLNADLISMQLFTSYAEFKDFNHDSVFEKWAAIEVADFSQVPGGLETFIINSGLYAMFHYKGAANNFGDTLYYIFTTWFPGSGFSVDNTRPHFAVMGEKYKGNDPESEEDLYIPIKTTT